MENNAAHNDYRIAVPAEFEEVFSHFYFAENKSNNASTKTLLPSFQIMMVFCFGAAVSFQAKDNDQIAVSKCMVIGPIKHAFNYTLSAGAEILVASFKDDAFFRFFGTASVAEYQHPDDLSEANCFTALWTELSEMKSVDDRIGHILAFCKPYIGNRHPLTEQIIALNDRNISPVKEVSDKANLSERSVQMNLKKYLGYSSREIGRYMRFLKAIQLIQQIACDTKQVDWFEVIEECGYYDQSQLIHDFKYYMDLSPSKYLKFQQSICSARI